MHICFIVPGYPTKGDPTMTFVRDLIVEIAQMGIRCSVIAPQSITRAWKNKVPIRKKIWQDYTETGATIEIYQPFYITAAGRASKCCDKMWAFVANRVVKKFAKSIDLCYAHFWHNGYLASQLNLDCPLIVASGESRITCLCNRTFDDFRVMFEKLSGVVYVGKKNYLESVELGLQKDAPYIIAPNGYNPRMFYPIDKGQIREELGFPQEKFVVSFVGFFYTRKGIDRLNEALKILNDSGDEVYSIFIGDGEIIPDCGNILFCGKLDHNDICKYINASDVFVLPTLAEGCCNAIIEAEACGLPIISSKGIFNDDILNEDNSIRIDPMRIDDIVNAIRTLKYDRALRRHLSEGALRMAGELTLKRRANAIVQFIEGVTEKNGKK